MYSHGIAYLESKKLGISPAGSDARVMKCHSAQIVSYISTPSYISNKPRHPGKQTWNPNHEFLEDDFPIQRGDFQVQC